MGAGTTRCCPGRIRSGSPTRERLARWSRCQAAVTSASSAAGPEQVPPRSTTASRRAGPRPRAVADTAPARAAGVAGPAPTARSGSGSPVRDAMPGAAPGAAWPRVRERGADRRRTDGEAEQGDDRGAGDGGAGPLRGPRAPGDQRAAGREGAGQPGESHERRRPQQPRAAHEQGGRAETREHLVEGEGRQRRGPVGGERRRATRRNGSPASPHAPAAPAPHSASARQPRSSVGNPRARMS